jgi:uncharacterized coiled-coil protein SlyX
LSIEIRTSPFLSSLVDQRGQWESRLAVETALNVQLRSQLEQLNLNHDREKSRLVAEHRKTITNMTDQLDELRKEMQKNVETRAMTSSTEFAPPPQDTHSHYRSPKPVFGLVYL